MMLNWADHTSAVASFFQGVARAYTDRPVEVEVLTFAPDLRFVGTVIDDTDAGCYRMFLADKLSGRDLLANAFHELYHVTHDKVAQWDTFGVDVHRRTLTGSRDRFADLTRASYQKTADRARVSEDHVDDWAIEQTARWWPVLEASVLATVDRLERENGW